MTLDCLKVILKEVRVIRVEDTRCYYYFLNVVSDNQEVQRKLKEDFSKKVHTHTP